MIMSFACRDTEKLFCNKHVNKFSAFLRKAQIKLKLLNAAKIINDLRSPPGNRLELLAGRKGQYSICILTINGVYVFFGMMAMPIKLKL